MVANAPTQGSQHIHESLDIIRGISHHAHCNSPKNVTAVIPVFKAAVPASSALCGCLWITPYKPVTNALAAAVKHKLNHVQTS